MTVLRAGQRLPAGATGPAAAGLGAVRESRALGEERRALVVGLVIAASIVASMAVNTPPVVLGASATAVLAAVLSPATGLVTLAVMAPLKSPALPAPGFNAFLVAAILVGCLFRLPIDRRPLRIGLPVVLLSAFVLYVGVQQLPEMLAGYTGGRTNHLIGYYFFQLVTGFAVVLGAAYVLRDRPPYVVIVAGLTAAVVAALLAIATFGSDTVRGPLVGLIAVPEDLDRAVGPFGNPNYFGQFQAMAIILGVAMLPVVSRRFRVVLGVALAPLATALALSLSRGAAVTLLAGLIVLAFARSRRLGVAALVTAALLVALAYPAFVQWRLDQTNPNSVVAYSTLVRSDDARLDAVLAGPQLFLSSPLFGIGWGRYQQASSQVLGYRNSAHNWYSKVVAEQGTVGIVLWGALLASVVVQLRRRTGTSRVVGLALLSAYAIGSLFAEPPSSFQASALALLVITAAIVGDWRRVPGLDPRADGSTAEDDPTVERNAVRRAAAGRGRTEPGLSARITGPQARETIG